MEAITPPRKILYIAGYGRSGSTVLDIILGNHETMVSTGEMGWLPTDWINPQRTCACGLRYRQCEFWSPLSRNAFPAPDGIRRLRRIECTASLPLLVSGAMRRATREEYAVFQRRLMQHTRAQSGKAFIVDSSKSARATGARPLALNRLAGEDVFLLHLIRDGRATMESLIFSGSNWVLEGHRSQPPALAIRTALGWVHANMVAKFVGRQLGSGRYLMVRFEDLLQDPSETLSRIGDFVGVSFGQLIDQIKHNDPFPVGHLVGGNRVRFAGSIRLWSKPEPRETGRLNWRHRLLFQCIGGRMRRSYGYLDE